MKTPPVAIREFFCRTNFSVVVLSNAGYRTGCAASERLPVAIDFSSEAARAVLLESSVLLAATGRIAPYR